MSYSTPCWTGRWGQVCSHLSSLRIAGAINSSGNASHIVHRKVGNYPSSSWIQGACAGLWIRGVGGWRMFLFGDQQIPESGGERTTQRLRL
ncbi:hypothetical protein GDO81_028980 [Engystomops pustulosus]|uniref:Uncharacterized protein n=1 Tax=Engystomops pustulosus TaxID=76066 RepID=A0AAV6YJX8_ENGPU|nr:hypothetical protein GDO81_028980 [Engystomops pustulosus]